ncbi:MAG: helix-turn-helix domain-containing protein [Woeseiaceae bacterium]|nr:helix-turn-helix domain-containing protein [Woeseiaceae bacterium]
MPIRKNGSKARNDKDDLVFKALAGADRRRILDLLRDTPMTTGELSKRLPQLDRTTVMQHLGVLEKARLVVSRKEGRCRWNYLDVSPIQRIHERWIRSYAMPSAKLLNKLRTGLES